MDDAKLLQAYRSQKCAAAKRGIGFHLSFNDWMAWWISTGKLAQRGKTKGCFQMCRRNDAGDYELGNIYCDTVENNSKLPIEGNPRAIGATEKALETRRRNGKPWFPNGVHKPSMDAARLKVFELIAWAIETKNPLYKGFKIFKCSGNAMRAYVPEWEKLNGPIPLPKRASGDKNGIHKYYRETPPELRTKRVFKEKTCPACGMVGKGGAISLHIKKCAPPQERI